MPPTDPQLAERQRRRDLIGEKRKITRGFQEEGAPKAVVFQRIRVQFDGAAEGSYWNCPTCPHKPWAWQDECPRCGTEKP